MEQVPLIPEVLEPLEDSSETAADGSDLGGRPRNTKRYRVLEAMARQEAPRIVQRLINSAVAGDNFAAKLILDRVWPRPRTAPIEIKLPATNNPAQVREAMHKLLGQVAAGEIEPTQGAAFIQIMREVLEAHRIQTFDPTGGGETRAVDYREQLTEKLLRALEERRRLAAQAEGPAEAPAAEQPK